MFLFRHFVELTIKDLLLFLSDGDASIQRQALGHDLRKLWIFLIERMKILSLDVVDFRDTFEGLIEGFAEADKKGDSFRYSTSSDGNQHWSNEWEVDLYGLIMFVKSFEVWCRGIEHQYNEARS